MAVSQTKLYDIIIVGAGPAGLSCAIEAKRAGLNALVIDKGNVVNAIQHFQREMYFFSTPELLEIGGVPFVIPTVRPTSLDCVNYYRKVTEVHQLNCHCYDGVQSVTKNDGSFHVRTSHGNQFLGGAVVIATGYYDSPNPLGVPGEDLPFVSHYYRDSLPYFRQRVLIVGGKNSAVEAALDLYRHGSRVTVVHRGQTLSSGVKYWIQPDFENRVKDGSIKLHLTTTVQQFMPGVAELQRSDGTRWMEEIDFAFILIGYRPDVKFLQAAGVEVDPQTLAPVFNPDTCETNVPKLFVAGGLLGGRFNNKVFIENGREHGKKILAALQK